MSRRGTTPPGTYISPAETGLYYLQSRYYDPEMGRFLNGDLPELAIISQDILQHNLFTYCVNEPAGNCDLYGYISFKIKISTIAGIAYGLSKTLKYTGMVMRSWKEWAQLALAFVKGFIIGFCTVYSLFSISKKLIKSIISGILNVVVELTLGNIRSAGSLLGAFIDGYGESLSPSFIKSKKFNYFKDTITYLSKLFTIKVY